MSTAHHHHAAGPHTTRTSLSSDALPRLLLLLLVLPSSGLQVSGQPLDVFMRERLFLPLGMVDTGFFVPPEKLERLAPWVLASGDPEQASRYHLPTWTHNRPSPSFIHTYLPMRSRHRSHCHSIYQNTLA